MQVGLRNSVTSLLTKKEEKHCLSPFYPYIQSAASSQMELSESAAV